MNRNFFILLIAGVLSSFSAFAQELNCVINFDLSNVQMSSADKTLLDNFKAAATTFMNTRKWTNDVFQPFERIDCNIYITIKEVPAFGSFVATASIQASRPVYESTYRTTLLNYLDKDFNFDYNPSQPFDFNENTYFTNLTSMLGFYAYMILATDYDTFSKLGGTPYYEKARNIALVAQPYGDAWSQGNNTLNRFYLMNNITNTQYLPLREGLYTYHRLALDQFIKNPDQARKDIFEVLKKIKTVLMYDPASIYIRSFFLAKSVEITNIYKDAPSDLKNKVVELLRDIDPANGEKYATKILGR